MPYPNSMTGGSANRPILTSDLAARSRFSSLGWGVLGALMLAFFWQPLLLGRAFYAFDLSMAYLPVQLENARLRAQGEFPLWNRYMYCGYPINAESEAGGLYPPALIFNLPLGPERAYTGYILFHYFLAFGSMLLLGRYLGLGSLGRTVGAAVLTFGGTFVSQTVNLPLVTTFAWVPLILALQLRALQRGVYGPAVLAGVLLGVQLLGAHPQMTFYGGLMMLLLAWLRPGADASPVRFWFSARVFAVIMLVGLGLGAPQLLYNLELLGHSDRSGGGTYEFLTSYSFPPHYLAQLLVPDLLGTGSNYVGTEVLEEQRVYLGLVTLGVLAVGWRMAGRAGRFLRIVLVSSLILSFGHFVGLYHVLRYVPGFSLFRCPSRWWFPLALAAAMLAGHGVDRILGGRGRVATRARVGFWCYAILAVVLLGIGLAVREYGRGATPAPGGVSQESLVLRAYASIVDWGIQHRRVHVSTRDPERFAEMLPAALGECGRSALWAALVAGLVSVWWWFSRRVPSARIMAPALLVLLGADLWLASGRIHHFAPGDYYRTSSERLEIYRSDPSHFRIMPSDRLRFLDPDTSALTDNFGSLHQLEVLDGFTSVDLKQMNTFVAGVMTRTQLNIVGAKYFQVPFPLKMPGLTEIRRDGEWYVYLNEEVLPRVMLLRSYEVIPEEDILFARLRSPAFDPSKTVLLEAEAEYHPDAAKRAVERDLLGPPEYVGQSVRVHVELADKAILVLSDFFYPGWRATVNGKPVPIQRANGIFRALALGPGVHDVAFIYRPRSFYAGLSIALVTLVGLVVWVVMAASKRLRSAG